MLVERIGHLLAVDPPTYLSWFSSKSRGWGLYCQLTLYLLYLLMHPSPKEAVDKDNEKGDKTHFTLLLHPF